MSQFYDQASLVMVPSGYKAGKVYSQKPLSTDGELTFTRNSNATRVNADGLVEKVRTNLVRYSQDFSNAAWSKSAGTTLTHSQSDPNSGTTATRVVMTSGANNYLYQGITTNAGTYAVSIYIKGTSGSGSICLSSGTSASRIGNTINYTTSWARYSIIATEPVNISGFQLDNYSDGLGQIGSDFIIAFAQNEVSDFGPTDYIPTTSAAVSVGPTANVPRLNYSNGCPSLLLEPQATALNQFSEQFDNAYWLKNAATIVANHATSPDGYQNADLLYPTSAGISRYVLKFVGATSGLAYTTSVFAKASGKNWLGMSNVDSGSTTAWFNLSTGTVGTVLSGTTAKMESYGNGWYRCSVTRTAAATTGAIVLLVEDADNSDSVTPNGTDGILIWGANLTQTSYVQSYIPTLGASVTRLVDTMSKASYTCGITTEATLFAEFEYQNTGSGYSTQFLIYNPSAGNYIYMTVLSNSIRAICVSGGVLQTNLILASTTAGTRYKVAARFKTNDFAMYVNGTLADTDTSGTMPTFSTASTNSYIGNDASNTEPAGNVYQYLAFPTALSNADLATLTTL